MLIQQKCFPFTLPVEWHKPEHYPSLPSHLADWLLHTGSLTERLQALTSNFNLSLLGQGSVPVAENEANWLAGEANALALPQSHVNTAWQIREVLLQGSKPEINSLQCDWVFARSVLPTALCDAKWVDLGEQPLGQRIFNDPSFVRSEFEIGLLTCHPLTNEVLSMAHPCWARRSKFKIDHFELIVAEAFLPDAPCYW